MIECFVMGTVQSIETKWAVLKKRFTDCSSQEHIYHQIILLGKELPSLPEKFKQEKFLVQGCQSQVYLHSFLEGNKMVYEADSEGLIAKGLAALLTLVYSGEAPEIVLTTPLDYLDEIGLKNALTPSRTNGLLSIHLRMKQEALKYLIG